MNNQSAFLFVYGTLQPSFSNPFAQYLRRFSRCVGKGAITGRLFAIGRYPGVLYETDKPTLVYGTVVELTHQPSTVLAYLDDYEGVGESFAQPTEYRRVIIPVSVGNQTYPCWTYVYNWPTDAYPLIPSGDYCLYLSRQA